MCTSLTAHRAGMVGTIHCNQTLYCVFMLNKGMMLLVQMGKLHLTVETLGILKL